MTIKPIPHTSTQITPLSKVAKTLAQTEGSRLDIVAPRSWFHDPDGGIRLPGDVPPSPPVDPAVTRLPVDQHGRVWVPGEGWKTWTLAEADYWARRQHVLHLPLRGLRGRTACSCGAIALGRCPTAAWVRSWVAYSTEVDRQISPPPAPAVGGLQCVMRLDAIGTDVPMTVGCDGVARIGEHAQVRLPAIDRALGRHIMALRRLHQPIGRPGRVRAGRHTCLNHGICYGCARGYGPTWSVHLCPYQWTHAWLAIPRWWRDCVGRPCHHWPTTTPPHQCTQPPRRNERP